MNEQLITKILNYREKLNIIALLLSKFSREKAEEIVKAIYDIDLDDIEKRI